MRTYNIYFNNTTGEVKAIYDGLSEPGDEFAYVDSVQHDLSNQSSQMLRNKVIGIMSRSRPSLDFGAHSTVTFHDIEPYGTERTEESERNLHPEKFNDEGEAKVATEEQLEPGTDPVPQSTETPADEPKEEATPEAVLRETPANTTATTTETPAETEVVKAEKITLAVPETSLIVGQTFTITATVEPDNAEDKTVVYESSDKAIAAVDGSGTVTAVSKGQATIRAAIDSNLDVYSDTVVTVDEAPTE